MTWYNEMPVPASLSRTEDRIILLPVVAGGKQTVAE